MLGELGVSHTRYYTPDEPAYYQLADVFFRGRRDVLRRYFNNGEISYPGIGIEIAATARGIEVLQPIEGGREIPVEVFSRLMDDGARTETSGLTVLAVRDLRERRGAGEIEALALATDHFFSGAAARWSSDLFFACSDLIRPSMPLSRTWLENSVR